MAPHEPASSESASPTERGERLLVTHADAVARPGYTELLRVPALSLGLDALERGRPDLQEPHRQDEVYVVIAGSAVLEVDGERTPVSVGSVAYVPAGCPHRFVEAGDDLHVFVVFAPPET